MHNGMLLNIGGTVAASTDPPALFELEDIDTYITLFC